MSARAQLQARLAAAVAEVRVIRKNCRTAGRLHLRQRKMKDRSSNNARTARLLALANVYANGDEDIVGLIAVLLRGATVAEATGAVADSIHVSSLADSRHYHLAIWARMAATTAPLRDLAAKAQRLVAEARVAVWVRRMNRNGVAPMAEQLVNRLFQEWPAGRGAAVDRAWQQLLRTSAGVKKKWIRSFTGRWGCRWQALTARGSTWRNGGGGKLYPFQLVGGEQEENAGQFVFRPRAKTTTILRTVFEVIFDPPQFWALLYVFISGAPFRGPFFDTKNGAHDRAENKHLVFPGQCRCWLSCSGRIGYFTAFTFITGPLC